MAGGRVSPLRGPGTRRVTDRRPKETAHMYIGGGLLLLIVIILLLVLIF